MITVTNVQRGAGGEAGGRLRPSNRATGWPAAERLVRRILHGVKPYAVKLMAEPRTLLQAERIDGLQAAQRIGEAQGRT